MQNEGIIGHVSDGGRQMKKLWKTIEEKDLEIKKLKQRCSDLKSTVIWFADRKIFELAKSFYGQENYIQCDHLAKEAVDNDDKILRGEK